MNVRGTGFFTGFLANMFILLVATLFRLNEYRKEQEQEAREKLRKNQEAQIQYLKSQVNPHFLFNTLNNLYGLAYAKSDLAPQMIIELSDTMRYLIYETEKDAVSVEKELDFIRNYINIEKKRLSHPENIRLTMHINHSDGLIPPLLLLPFVENCFKHGTIGKTKEGWIEMGMWDDPKFFHFTCKNSYADGHQLVSTEKNSGLGLQNVKKRLDLLFGNQYELTISKQNNEYVVYLKIPFMVKKKPA
ncbi:MAG: sensor histidine kinase [Porphyromonadaceae bacterium]|nr:sensor histidine kinase [Porphyromonadaceae bacterium]